MLYGLFTFLFGILVFSFPQKDTEVLQFVSGAMFMMIAIMILGFWRIVEGEDYQCKQYVVVYVCCRFR